MVLRRITWILLVCLVAALPASANLVANGSFENPVVSANARCDTWGANGWTASLAGSNPESTYIFNAASNGWVAAQGANVLTMFPSSGGPSVSQTLTTVVGQAYDFSFALLGASWYGQGTTVTVSWISNSVDLIGQWAQAAGTTTWETKHFLVTAGSTSDTIKLTYADYQTGFWGAANIDNVQVNAAVPEPGSLCAMLVGLAGVIGLKRRPR